MHPKRLNTNNWHKLSRVIVHTPSILYIVLFQRVFGAVCDSRVCLSLLRPLIDILFSNIICLEIYVSNSYPDYWVINKMFVHTQTQLLKTQTTGADVLKVNTPSSSEHKDVSLVTKVLAGQNDHSFAQQNILFNREITQVWWQNPFWKQTTL